MTSPIHPICRPCWRERYETTDGMPDSGVGPLIRCCFCGYLTNSRLTVESSIPQLTCDHESAIADTQT